MKTIVFDFDKTLTNYDTMTAFLLYGMKKNKKKYIFLPFLFFIKVAAKLRMISIKSEKEILIKLIMPTEVDEFKKICTSFSKTIKFNDLINVLIDTKEEGQRVIVLSASPEAYIKDLFPDINVIGTTFAIEDNQIKRISQHPYGKEKQTILIRNTINKIDLFYYDSKSDEALLPICKAYVKISNGRVVNSVNL